MSPVPEGAPYFTVLAYRKDAGIKANSAFVEAFFPNTIMNRSIRSIDCTFSGRRLLIATSHLESPMGPGTPYQHEISIFTGSARPPLLAGWPR